MKSQTNYSSNKRSVFTVACCVALATFIALPAFAQRGENQGQRNEGSRGDGGSHENRGKAVAPAQAQGNRAAQPSQVSRGGENRGSAVSANRSQGGNAPQVNRGGNAPQNYRANVGGGPGNVRQSTMRGGDNRSYGRGPSRGAMVNVFPQGGRWHYYNGQRYGYYNGYYYRPYGSSYMVVAPPFGFRIGALPLGFITFSLANAAYYYYGGTYYQRENNEYVVVQPPLGALVQTIPDGGQQVVVDGNTFYIVDGIQYQAVMYRGSIWYKVIKIENQVNDYDGASPNY